MSERSLRASGRADRRHETGSSRIAGARGRMRVAKIVVASAAAIGFGAAMALARATDAGHPKHTIRPLAIPQPLYEVVRKNLLQAGIVAPASAPPDAATSTS